MSKPSGAWMRVRFHANEDDYRPVKVPPPGPYWCSGEGDGYSIIVAYVQRRKQITDFWPEATEIDVLEDNCEIAFSDRFAKPKWWKP